MSVLDDVGAAASSLRWLGSLAVFINTPAFINSDTSDSWDGVARKLTRTDTHQNTNSSAHTHIKTALTFPLMTEEYLFHAKPNQGQERGDPPSFPCYRTQVLSSRWLNELQQIHSTTAHLNGPVMDIDCFNHTHIC